MKNKDTSIFSAIIHKEEDMYVAECPETQTVSQGKTINKAIENLKEATELYLEEFPEPKNLTDETSGIIQFNKEVDVREEIEEFIFLNNQDSIESIKRADKDIKAGRATTCRTHEEIENHLNSL